MRYLLVATLVLGLATLSFAFPTANAIDGCTVKDPNCEGLVCVRGVCVDGCAGRTDCCDGGLPQRPFWCPEDS